MGNFLIGKVTKILPNSERDQVIEAEVGTEFKVKAYPLHTIQQVKLEDEVLLIKVSESFDTYFYLLLRLNQEFKYYYNQMVLGFNDEKSIIIEAPEIILRGDNLKIESKTVEMSSKTKIDVSKMTGAKSDTGLLGTIKYDEPLGSYVLTAEKKE